MRTVLLCLAALVLTACDISVRSSERIKVENPPNVKINYIKISDNHYSVRYTYEDGVECIALISDVIKGSGGLSCNWERSKQ